MIDIHTSRVFIPSPMYPDGPRQVFGPGYEEMRYNIQRAAANIDDVFEMRELYDFVSSQYKIDVSQMPRVRPFVQYVDFVRARGGISSGDNAAINYLKTRCNTLIVPDRAEREYLEELYLNILGRDTGARAMPVRFGQKVR